MNDIINIKEPEWSLIWKNPTGTVVSSCFLPTASFPEQTLELDLSKYCEIRIEYAAGYYDEAAANPDDYYSLMYQDFEVGGSGQIWHWGISFTGNNSTSNGKNPFIFVRYVFVTSNEIMFTASYVKNCNTNEVKNSQATTTIPVRIWAR